MSEALVLMKNALRLDQPWPIQNVLRRLADGADQLLDDHSHDATGHEDLDLCRRFAREMAENLDEILAGRPVNE